MPDDDDARWFDALVIEPASDAAQRGSVPRPTPPSDALTEDWTAEPA